MIGTKLEDPKGICKSPEHRRYLNKKLAATLSALSIKPKNGGNPFLFAILASKRHVLIDYLDGRELKTAATDGKVFYWGLEFLEKLTPKELPIVASHETYHWICDHPRRGRGYIARIWAAAIDYVVNALVEKDHRFAGTHTHMWGGNLGNPWPLQDYMDWISGNNEAKPQTQEEEFLIYVDYSCVDKSPEEIYDLIQAVWKTSPRKCETCWALSLDPVTGESTIPRPWDANACPQCGAKSNGSGGASGEGTLDHHVEPATTEQEKLADVMRAVEQAKQMRGSIPGGVEGLLGKLSEPQLSFADLIRSLCKKKSNKAGLRNNWKRPRRKSLALDMYVPSKHGYKPRWVALLDTSGSMSDDNIAYCLSQLKSLQGDSEGWVVPVDSEVYWDKAVKINDIRELKNVKVHGRGGTVFDQFFEELPKKLGTDFDVVAVLTDGYVGQVPLKLAPPCDVVWIISGNTLYKPSFGRVAPLYGN